MIKCVLFDLDGTLLNTERFNVLAKVKEAKLLGYEISEEEVIATFGQDHKLSSQYFKNKYGKDFPYEEISSKRVEYILEDMKKNGLPYKPYALEIINYLKNNNYKIGLCTSSNLKTINKYARFGDLFTRFDIIVTQDEVNRGKPEPDIFLKAANSLKMNPNDTLVIEDAINGIKAALKGGFQVIMVPDLVKEDNFIKENNIKVVSSLKDVLSYLENNENGK